MANLTRLDHRLDPGARTCLAVVECGRGATLKIAYNPALEAFELKRSLPPGMAFPLDFGFVPSTRAEDGDPIDVMVLSETPIPMGVVAPVRLIGVIESAQSEGDRQVRNDRLLAVDLASHDHARVSDVETLDGAFVEGLVAFWLQYERLRGADFTVLGVEGPARAVQAVRLATVREGGSNPPQAS